MFKLIAFLAVFVSIVLPASGQQQGTFDSNAKMFIKDDGKAQPAGQSEAAFDANTDGSQQRVQSDMASAQKVAMNTTGQHDVSSWPHVKTDCSGAAAPLGAGSVLVNWNGKSCDEYCSTVSSNHYCVGAWEEEAVDQCVPRFDIYCHDILSASTDFITSDILCKCQAGTREYSQTSTGSNADACPSWDGKIADEATCKNAAAALGATERVPFTKGWSNRQPGCIRWGNNAVSFNTNAAGTTHGSVRSVCQDQRTPQPQAWTPNLTCGTGFTKNAATGETCGEIAVPAADMQCVSKCPAGQQVKNSQKCAIGGCDANTCCRDDVWNGVCPEGYLPTPGIPGHKGYKDKSEAIKECNADATCCAISQTNAGNTANHATGNQYRKGDCSGTYTSTGNWKSCRKDALAFDLVTVHGPVCQGKSCSSIATCPTGYSLVACVSDPSNSQNGVKPSTTATPPRCTASGSGDWNSQYMIDLYGGGGRLYGERITSVGDKPIRAIATCSNNVRLDGSTALTTITDSGASWIRDAIASASCSSGTTLWCNCHSGWGSTPAAFGIWGLERGGACQITAFAPNGGVCQQAIPSLVQSNRRRGKTDPYGARVYALCAHLPPSLLQQAEGHQSTKSARSSPCAAGSYELTPIANGVVSCVDVCPAGYYVSGDVCAACAGTINRGVTPNTCTPCGAGYVARADHDDCQLLIATCVDETDPDMPCVKCATCMQGSRQALNECVSGTYTPGSAATPHSTCADEEANLQDCMSESYPCFYKSLCHADCVSTTWKATYCGGETSTDFSCAALLVQNASGPVEKFQERRQKQRGEPGQAATASLDESLSGKRSCR